ncbi:MAG: hypothetical protein LBM12_02720 [Candidatus Nomurabacteria bacterium]|jgi:hypothetical protein|nr:hypothetical protein [Candidatus Nomurabacteria bacterium]
MAAVGEVSSIAAEAALGERSSEGVSGGSKLVLTVMAAIAVAIGMVAVSLALYYHSGAYLADSSRVGAEKTLPVGDDWQFEAVGPLTGEEFELFINHFDTNFKAVKRASF